MKARRFWSDMELKLLMSLYPDTPTEQVAKRLGRPISAIYNKVFQLRLKKSEHYLSGPFASRFRGGDIGKAYQFPKGHVPFNKGLKCWKAGGRSVETQFKKGILRGRALQRYKPIGTERLDKDGYLERKVRDDGPSKKRWRGIHVILWEQAYGEIPPGYAVCFINGDKKDIRLDNLVLLSRVDLMQKNSYYNRYPKEIGRIIQLRGVLMRQINRRTNEESHRRPA